MQLPRAHLTLLAAAALLAGLLELASHHQTSCQRLFGRPPTTGRPATAAAAANQTSAQARAQPAAALGQAGPPSVAAAKPAEPGAAEAGGQAPGAPRATRTADVFQNGDGFNLFVTNTCQRESMQVNIRTSRPFYGKIHTRDQPKNPACVIEGNGGSDYTLEISHVLNQQDPNYCGVIRARRESAADKDLLSVVLAVRVHRTIELSDDKFFLLNCTNRCRRPDCSSPGGARDLEDDLRSPSNKLSDLTETEAGSAERENAPNNNNDKHNDPNKPDDECTIWKFPWAITLFWCLGILLLAMMISHCIMCSSMVCRSVKTEIEEHEPSIYEGASDLDENQTYNKKHPHRIDYDNKEIYNTSNNYAPYSLASDKASRKHRSSQR